MKHPLNKVQSTYKCALVSALTVSFASALVMGACKGEGVSDDNNEGGASSGGKTDCKGSKCDSGSGGKGSGGKGSGGAPATGTGGAMGGDPNPFGGMGGQGGEPGTGGSEPGSGGKGSGGAANNSPVYGVLTQVFGTEGGDNTSYLSAVKKFEGQELPIGEGLEIAGRAIAAGRPNSGELFVGTDQGPGRGQLPQRWAHQNRRICRSILLRE
jgi:hypothetical protein